MSRSSRFRAELLVTPRRGVRDPQAEAVEEALAGLGHAGTAVRCVGRYLELELDAADVGAARAALERMCDELLVNPNLEEAQIGSIGSIGSIGLIEPLDALTADGEVDGGAG